MDKVKVTETTAQPIYKQELPVVQYTQQQHHPVPQPAVMKAHCESHMHRYVEIHTADGCCYDGIVEHVDDEFICLAVPGATDDFRGFFPPPPFYPQYGPYYPFRPRRFNRLVLPLAALTALSLLPYYW